MSDRCNAPVGVFDSGVGGLTVAREIMRNLPEENIVYFGDTARVPYGTKSKDTCVTSTALPPPLTALAIPVIVIAHTSTAAVMIITFFFFKEFPPFGHVLKSHRQKCQRSALHTVPHGCRA